jgi:hypothetical protein
MMTGKTKANEIANGGRASSLPPPRDPSVALAEEYEFARRTGTAEALELFIARHNGDPLAQKLCAAPAVMVIRRLCSKRQVRRGAFVG